LFSVENILAMGWKFLISKYNFGTFEFKMEHYTTVVVTGCCLHAGVREALNVLCVGRLSA